MTVKQLLKDFVYHTQLWNRIFVIIDQLKHFLNYIDQKVTKYLFALSFDIFLVLYIIYWIIYGSILLLSVISLDKKEKLKNQVVLLRNYTWVKFITLIHTYSIKIEDRNRLRLHKTVYLNGQKQNESKELFLVSIYILPNILLTLEVRELESRHLNSLNILHRKIQTSVKNLGFIYKRSMVSRLSLLLSPTPLGAEIGKVRGFMSSFITVYPIVVRKDLIRDHIHLRCLYPTTFKIE